jgi:hypothetical protein
MVLLFISRQDGKESKEAKFFLWNGYNRKPCQNFLYDIPSLLNFAIA